MIRVVLDTNIVISGSLWSGAPHRVLDTITQDITRPVVTEIMLEELTEVLHREKFEGRLQIVGKTPDQIVNEYAASAEVVEAASLNKPVASDPDDDMFLACAISGHAEMIVSGDPHLLDVKEYGGIRIVTAAGFLEYLQTQR